MDPTSALGAVAASAQFLGYGIKGLLYAAQLLHDIKGAPDDSLRIVTRLGKEITSINRLLSSESSTFSQLTTAQYAHITPWAVDARKALDEANSILTPISTHLHELRNQDGARKRVQQAWKSLLTVKAMREIEKQMETIQMLNASLIREFVVAGFETQDLLREQSAEVLAKVNEIDSINSQLQQRLRDLDRKHSKASEMVMASSTSVANGLELLNQASEQRQVSLAQTMSHIDNEMSTVRSELQMIDEHSKTLNLSLGKVGTAVTDQNLHLATELRNYIRVQGAENQKALVGEIKDMFVTELLTTAHHFARDHRWFTQTRDSTTQPSAITKSTEFSLTVRSSDFMRCSAQVDPTGCMGSHMHNPHSYHLEICRTISEYDEMADSLQTELAIRSGWGDIEEYLDWMIKDPDFAAGAGYSDPIHQAVLRRSLDALKRHFWPDHNNGTEFDDDNMDLIPMAVGWPDGLQYLIDRQNCLDLVALKYAVAKQAVSSVEIILSADSSKLFTLDYIYLATIWGWDHLYPTILLYCESDLAMFRRATETLRDRNDKREKQVPGSSFLKC
ncbi:hypothetical protein E8E14_005991 [Neopestalotiopsis sp. 37M]|nr:hypothetical protein E8E14_005991 [Neopestalotiopsis sp. 37M]